MFENAGTLESVIFVCSLCSNHHVAIERNPKNGVFLIPNTITTSKRAGEYYFHCVECPRDIRG